MPTPQAPSPNHSSRPGDRSAMRIHRDAAGLRVIFSMATIKGAYSNRGKMLERARRILAAAIEEEQRREVRADKTTQNDTSSTGRAPGTGAWWGF